LNWPFIDLRKQAVPTEARNAISTKVAFQYNAIPFDAQNGTLLIAVSNPFDTAMLNAVQFDAGKPVKFALATKGEIEKALKKYYGVGAETLDELAKDDDEPIDLDIGDKEITEGDQEASVIKFVNQIIWEAFKDRATDIHFEPAEDELRIRYRIDGILHQTPMPPQLKRYQAAIISRIKVMSGMNISEKRLPQDGRIKIKVKVDSRSRELDFRVSTLPTLFGEKVVLRLLDKQNLMLDMTKLGFEPESLVKFKRNISKPYGMVLVTGPTGSGKTNTLYSALQSLNTVDTNIMTAEDPVEFNLPGINQVQMKEQIGLNFAAALRSFLRQDPNIVLVGEIRDFETAEIAIKAALTGHLVLSTLHTNDAPSTISRLMNMGIEPFLVATSVNLIQAQRLIRRVCKDCKQEHQTPVEALIEVGFSSEEAKAIKTFKGKGCSTCNNTGYKGRIGLYEVMEITDEIRELILIGASALELRKKAIDDGMITLRESGLHKIRLGVTSPEEVVRETVA
jgi:type IV pilus assembly protein PilB